ncbi:sigma-70 family RNA polymerase sigma factor [Micromonospora sp. NBC_01638]|uniref:sigma-70 family RNA polymerase sigma factor n=1 Tax=Micromonospora sp. NBC_01638 TaxID=2975982 RepID=UPI00386C8D4F
MGEPEVRRTVEAVWRMESGRVIAGLAALVRDVGQAEELAQDALVAALETWPRDGVPVNPGAWLMTVGKRRAIDALRRRQTQDRKVAELGRDLGADEFIPDFDAAFEEHIEDDLLRLIFVACHPVLSPIARAALTLRLLGGLTTEEIARAFLTSEATVGQRITRAKQTLATRGEGPGWWDRGTVLTSLAVSIALGATSMSDIGLLAHQAPVFGDPVPCQNSSHRV